MNDTLNKLPSVRSMLKLIVVLILALIAVKLVLGILAVLTPIIIVAALIAGGVYLYQKLQTNGSKA